MTQPMVFISYSHEDEREKEELIAHLKVLAGEGLIDLWVDDRIGAGGDWQDEIDQAMSRARVAILLISANFLTSDFILNEEIPKLLERRAQEGLTVYPVIAKPCAWRKVGWLARMNVRPKNGRPVWREGGRYADEELARIAEEVAEIIEQAGSAKPRPAPALPPKRGESESAPLPAAPPPLLAVPPPIRHEPQPAPPAPAPSPQSPAPPGGDVNISDISGGEVDVGNIVTGSVDGDVVSGEKVGGDVVAGDKITYINIGRPSSPTATKQSLRRIDAAAPSQAEVGQHLDLLVQVRFPDSPYLSLKDWPTKTKPAAIEQTSDQVALEHPLDPATGKPAPARLEIEVVAPDFEIHGQAVQLINVPYDEYSEQLQFLLTARKTGSCRINVVVRSADHTYLGTIPIETTVGGTMTTTPTVSIANLVLVVNVGGMVINEAVTAEARPSIKEVVPAPKSSSGAAKVWVPIVVALIGLIGVIFAAVWNSSDPEPTPVPTVGDFTYQVRVQAKDTGENIPNVVVTIEVGGKAPLDGLTDSTGLARIFVSSSHAGRPGRLIVEADGYRKYRQEIDIVKGALPKDILLEPEP